MGDSTVFCFLSVGLWGFGFIELALALRFGTWGLRISAQIEYDQ